jgi:translation initiation factor 5B
VVVLINSSIDFPKAIVIFISISIFAFLSWFFTPEEKWLRKNQILEARETVDHPEDE